MRRRGSTAGVVVVEFAVIGASFLAFFLGVFQLSFLLYAQTALDYAAKIASRQLQTGQTTLTAGTTQATFEAVSFCPALRPFLSCSNITIVLQPVTDYKSAASNPVTTSTINPGGSGSLMMLQAYYAAPITLWPLQLETLVGTAAYRNEF